MSESLSTLYHKANRNENTEKWFPHHDPPFGVGAIDGVVTVWLTEDTEIQTTLDPDALSAKTFNRRVFEFVRSQR
jgi:hypothetical protein